MSRFALITNGVVTNIVEQDDLPPSEFNPVLTDIAHVGWNYDGVDFIDTTPVYVPPVLTYAQKRQAAHLPIQDQLDMQYHDAINGTTLWLDYVTAIKTSIPKELPNA